MKLRLSSSIFLLVLASHTAIGAIPGKLYVGAFGGGGASNDLNVSQYGTVFLIEAQGGPLAVDAFGQLANESGAFFGGQLGYQSQQILLHPSSRWTLGPAAELEGYYINKRSFNGTLINDNVRLDEHDFAVTYPISRSVFLANAVLNFNHPSFLVNPYIGVGIGNAVVRISNANSIQTNPSEAGVNHYNTNPSDSTSAFAGQLKIGLSYDINQYFSIFADYRWLYIASTDFAFGSTAYPDHAATSNWQVNIDSQRYNLGNIGIRFTL